jgi:hypothetical protein
MIPTYAITIQEGSPIAMIATTIDRAAMPNAPYAAVDFIFYLREIEQIF